MGSPSLRTELQVVWNSPHLGHSCSNLVRNLSTFARFCRRGGAVVEVADDRVEGGDADVAGVVLGGASPESVDVGSEVEWVGHGLGLSGIGTVVLIMMRLGRGGETGTEISCLAEWVVRDRRSARGHRADRISRRPSRGLCRSS